MGQGLAPTRRGRNATYSLTNLLTTNPDPTPTPNPSPTPNQECVNTLVKESEDRAGELVIILTIEPYATPCPYA